MNDLKADAMKCLRCNTDLYLSDTVGIEFDFCPLCKGVWLDRGELEKIIERSNTLERSFNRDSEYPGHEDKFHLENKYHNDHKNKGKRGFLSDLFDF